MKYKESARVLEVKDGVDNLISEMQEPLERFLMGNKEEDFNLHERRLMVLRAASFVWLKMQGLVEQSYLHNKLKEIEEKATAKATTNRGDNGTNRLRLGASKAAHGKKSSKRRVER